MEKNNNTLNKHKWNINSREKKHRIGIFESKAKGINYVLTEKRLSDALSYGCKYFGTSADSWCPDSPWN